VAIGAGCLGLSGAVLFRRLAMHYLCHCVVPSGDHRSIGNQLRRPSARAHPVTHTLVCATIRTRGVDAVDDIWPATASVGQVMRLPKFTVGYGARVLIFPNRWVRGDEQDRSEVDLANPWLGQLELVINADAALADLVLDNLAARVRFGRLETEPDVLAAGDEIKYPAGGRRHFKLLYYELLSVLPRLLRY
jgi:hypothetical protein